MKNARLLVIFQVLIVSGCSTFPEMTPVTNSDFRATVVGATAGSPSGSDWYYWKHSSLPPNTVAFYKHFEGPSLEEQAKRAHTYFVSLSVGINDMKFDGAEALGEHLEKNTRAEHSGSQRFRLIDYSWEVYKRFNANCVKIHSIQEDFNHPAHPGKLFIKDGYQINCLHPVSPGYFVQILYGESRPKGEPARDFSNEVQSLLDTLKFTPVK